MKINKSAWNISVKNRASYLKHVQQYFTFSPSQLASLLTEVANKAGYTTRLNPITGGAVISHAKSGKAPLWLCRAALDLILTQGYLPDSDDEWVTLVALLLLNVEGELTSSFMSSLPEQVNKFAFKEWVSIVEY
jgi:hypothetical protein